MFIDAYWLKIGYKYTLRRDLEVTLTDKTENRISEDQRRQDKNHDCVLFLWSYEKAKKDVD